MAAPSLASNSDDTTRDSPDKLTIEGRPAGVDLKELVHISTAEAHQRNFLKDLTDAFARFSKPTVAAVAGFAVSDLACSTILDILTSEQLGGGCEMALAVSDHNDI